eukprot:3982907-Amphidinium_carterae.1
MDLRYQELEDTMGMNPLVIIRRAIQGSLNVSSRMVAIFLEMTMMNLMRKMKDMDLMVTLKPHS